ncbi:D-alanyl-D-alanine carboxypeptidase [bacterium]|nr:D-alanyl-D-alanine carboxypeptidase [bacterium]
MKKLVVSFLVLLLLFPMVVKADDLALIPNAKSGVLMEESTGKIIFEKNKDEKVAVASMTKMVAQILILEAIEKGQIKWTDKVTASANASSMGGSQIFLSTGEVLTVEEMMKGISMASANDATVAMAEFLKGTEIDFVKEMNKKVKSLGLKNTQFKNCTGLDEEGHYSTAYDMAIIAKELLKHEEILKFSSKYEDYLRVNTPNKFWLVNTNKLVRFYEGADGLKTGHTDAAKYCLAATAKKNDMRLIAIVLGEEVSKVRNSETMALLDYGFNTYQVQIIKKKNEIVKTENIEKASTKKIEYVPVTDIGILSKKGDTKKKYSYDIKITKNKLPLTKGEIVGKIKIKDGNTVVGEKDITVKKSTKKLSYLTLLRNTIYDIASGNTSIK